jgi:hypothetical protein
MTTLEEAIALLDPKLRKKIVPAVGMENSSVGKQVKR